MARGGAGETNWYDFVLTLCRILGGVNPVRRFVVGAYWGGLVAAAVGLLPLVLLRPQLVPQGLVEGMPALVLAGFALLTSVLAAGMMLILREIADLRGAMERGVGRRGAAPSRLTSWAASAAGSKVTVPCGACGRTNWAEAHGCVACGAPIMQGDVQGGGAATAH